MTTAAAPPPSGVYTLTLLDVYERQIEIRSDVAVIKERTASIPGLESRLRILELAKARVYGVAAVLGVLAGGGAGWAALALGRR